MGRNTPILQEIIGALSAEIDDDQRALDQLESHFRDRLLVDAGNVTAVGAYANELRLRITQEERLQVLDYIGERQMVLVNLDMVETAINELLGWDRFVEP